MRYAQLITGPAGSGKSTYCSALAQHAQMANKIVNVVNLDPAAEYFDYTPLLDIRELIHIDDAMEDNEMQFGPNGALVFCMEYLMENVQWLQEKLGDADDDYILFDCPGQIELYTHLTPIKNLIECLKNWNFSVCSIFIVDSQFMIDGAKFLSGTLAALSTMINLELPHLNILSKMDLLHKSTRKHLDRFLEPDPYTLLSDIHNKGSKWSDKYKKLTSSLGHLIEDYSLVRFYPLNIKDEESLNDIFLMINNMIQYGEDEDVKTKDFEEDDSYLEDWMAEIDEKNESIS